MAIDWNILQPIRGNAPEIASISNLLGAFAENRQRQQEAQRQREFQERQFAAQQANIAADNARADQQLQIQQAQQRAAAEHQRQEMERQKAETFAAKALPAAQAALRNGDLQGGRLAVQPYGGDITQDYTRGEAADAAVQERKASAADLSSAMAPLVPFGMALGGLPQALQANANASAQPTAEETRQMAPRYQISGPAGSTPFDFSPMEAEEGEKAARTRASSVAGEALSGLNTPYSARVLETARARALAGGTPEEAAVAGMTAGQHAEDLASREKNARLSAGQRAGTQADAATARATSLVERAVNDADRMVDWKGLVQMDNSLRSAIANATAPGSLPHKDAQIQLARVFRGTTPTEGEMHLLYNNLGGTMDKWDQFWAAAADGDLSDKQLAELRNASEIAFKEVNHRKERAIKGLRTKFNSPTYQMMTPQINAEIRARAETLGVDLPSDFLLSEEAAGDGPVLLGSRKGKGGKKAAGAAAKPRKSAEDWVKEYSQ